MPGQNTNTEFDSPRIVPSNEDRFARISEEYLKPNIGLLFLMTSHFFNSIMVVSTKLLETDPLLEEPIKPLQILVVRMFITFIGTLIYMQLNKDKIPHVPFGPPEVRKWLILRGFTGFFGVFGLYFSLMYLSVSDAVMITFLAPSFTGLLAWVILHERYSKIEALGGLVSLFGVILIVRPTFMFGAQSRTSSDESFESSDPRDRLVATLVSLLGVLGVSSVYIIIRYIGHRAHAIMSVTYFAFITCMISLFGILLIPSMTFQIPKTLKQWFLFFLIGISGFFMQLLLTLGIQRERAGRGALMAYGQMIYAIFWDILIWHHPPGLWSLCGMTIIIASTVTVIKFKPKQEEAVINDEENAAQVYHMEDFEIDDDNEDNGQDPK